MASSFPSSLKRVCVRRVWSSPAACSTQASQWPAAGHLRSTAADETRNLPSRSIRLLVSIQGVIAAQQEQRPRALRLPTAAIAQNTAASGRFHFFLHGLRGAALSRAGAACVTARQPCAAQQRPLQKYTRFCHVAALLGLGGSTSKLRNDIGSRQTLDCSARRQAWPRVVSPAAGWTDSRTSSPT